MKFLLTVSVFIFSFLISFSQNNVVDYSFGREGNVFINRRDTTLGYITPAGTTAAAILPDKKILISFMQADNGASASPRNFFRVMQLQPDGRIDSSFGLDGTTILNPGIRSYLWCMKRQDDGKIILGGSIYNTRSEMVVMRLLPNGKLDSSFNASGSRRINRQFGSHELNDIILRPDGKYLLIGDDNGKPTVALLRSNGIIDSTFGNNGWYSSFIAGTSNHGVRGVLHSDGYLTICSQIFNNNTPTMHFIRLKPNGKADSTFGTNGIYINPDLSKGAPRRILPAAGDKMYVAISGDTGMVCRLNKNGSFDSGFAVNGKLPLVVNGITYQISGFDMRTDSVLVVSIHNFPGEILAVSSSGSLISGFGNNGICRLPYNGGPHLAISNTDVYTYSVYDSQVETGLLKLSHILPNGSFNSSFGANGHKYFDFGGTRELIASINKLSDNTFLVSGSSNSAMFSKLWFHKKYLPNGKPDSSFGINGIQYSATRGGADIMRDMLVLPNDAFLTTGQIFENPNNIMFFNLGSCIRKQKPDGTIDSSFGDRGTYWPYSNWNPAYLEIFKLDAQPDGKILYTGELVDGSNSSLHKAIIGRLTADGRSDSSYGVNGKLSLSNPFYPYHYIIHTIKVLPGNKTIAAAQIYDGSKTVCELHQLKPSGVSDSLFGINGRVYYSSSLSSTALIPRDIAIQSDGKILLLASETNVSFSFVQSRVARFHPNGKPDSSFGINGTVLLPDITYKMLLQRDGKIILSQTPKNNNSEQNLYLRSLRLKANGQIDNSFGTNGTITFSDYHAVIPMEFEPNSFNSLTEPVPALNLMPDSSSLLLAGTVYNKDYDGWITKFSNSEHFPAAGIQIIDSFTCGALKLFWTSVNENNSSIFDVEYSKDSVNFKAIGQVNATAFTNGKTSYSFTVNNMDTSEGYYRVRLWSTTGSYLLSGSAKRKAGDETVPVTSVWTGAVNNSWDNPGNWSCGKVPNAYTNVVINSGTIFIGSNSICRTLSLDPAVILTVLPNYTLTVLF